jgi:hypothetical protein
MARPAAASLGLGCAGQIQCVIDQEERRTGCSVRMAYRPPFHARIAALEAGDFNKATVRVSDKQNYTFGQSCPRDRLAYGLGKDLKSCKNNRQ